MLLREYWNTGDDQGLGVSDTRWITQTYTPKFGQKISRVRMKLYRDAVLAPGTVTLSLRATTASKPSGVDLAVATLDGNTFTTNTNGEWYEFVLDSSVQNLGGILYSIVLGCAGSGSYPLRIRNDSSSGYGSGQHGYSDDSGGTWTMSSTQDDMFETYSDDPAAGSIGFYAGGSYYGNNNLWCIQYDPITYNLVISAAYNVGDNYSTTILSLAVANDGSIFVGTDSNKIYKYVPGMVLDTTWATNGVYSLGKYPYALAVDSSGYCAIGHAVTAAPNYYSVTLLNASGEPVWQSKFPSTMDSKDIGFDPDGNVIVVGGTSYSSARGYRLSRVDGSVLNSYWVLSGTGAANGCSIWPNGDVAIVDKTSTTGTIKKFNVSGSDIWAALSLSTGTTGLKSGHDSSDNIYVPSSLASGVSFQRIAADGGSILATYNTGAMQRQSIVISDDIVICVGTQETDQDTGAGCFRVFNTSLSRLSVIDIYSTVSLYGVALNTILPTITVQPFNTTVNEGGSVSLIVTAIGPPTPSYQWWFDDGGGYDSLPGKTNSTLTFIAARTDAGSYKCYADNVVGGVYSNPAILTVQYLEITGQPEDVITPKGQLASFIITAIGTPLPTYQWCKDGNPISGKTTSTLTFYCDFADAGSYSCIVTNAVGSTTSASATLTVITNPWRYNLFELQSDFARD